MPRTPGPKTKAVRQALEANPRKTPKEIAEILKEQGIDASAGYVSTIKSKGKGKGKRKKKAAAVAEAGPVLPKDAVSLALLRKAKKLAMELGGIKEAKAAIHALSEILD